MDHTSDPHTCSLMNGNVSFLCPWSTWKWKQPLWVEEPGMLDNSSWGGNGTRLFAKLPRVWSSWVYFKVILCVPWMVSGQFRLCWLHKLKVGFWETNYCFIYFLSSYLVSLETKTRVKEIGTKKWIVQPSSFTEDPFWSSLYIWVFIETELYLFPPTVTEKSCAFLFCCCFSYFTGGCTKAQCSAVSA